MGASDRGNGVKLSGFKLILSGLLVVFAAITASFLIWRGSEIAQPVSKEEDLTPWIEALRNVDLPDDLDSQSANRIVYQSTLDDGLVQKLKTLFRRYRPDLGSAVVMDAQTGAILGWWNHGQTIEDQQAWHRLAVFPAASVFKIVTAAAALDHAKLSATDMIGYNGANHTLYRRNVKENDVNRWTRFVPLTDAFAKSINTVFGKLGIFHLGPEIINDYATRFGFNRNSLTQIPFEWGRMHADLSDLWTLAEVSSGFTRESTLSPLHGALIAAAVAQNGTMPMPHLLLDAELGGERMSYEMPKAPVPFLNPHAAQELKTLMRHTIVAGTSRKSFRQVFRTGELKQLLAGGKTGSLDAHALNGRTDWFVGYLESDHRQYAISVVTLHREQWRVKSSLLAGLIMEYLLEAEVPTRAR